VSGNRRFLTLHYHPSETRPKVLHDRKMVRKSNAESALQTGTVAVSCRRELQTGTVAVSKSQFDRFAHGDRRQVAEPLNRRENRHAP